MPTPQQIQQAVQRITDQPSFIHVLLRDTLGWQIPEHVGEVEEIAYAWSADELHSDGLDEKIVDGQVWQIQPLNPDVAQSWGIFVLEFKHEDAFVAGRGLTGPLRKVLRGLVPKRRRQSNLPAWNRENLLFICTYRYCHFRFAHFKSPGGKERTSPLAQFGWNCGESDVRTLCEHNLVHLNWDSDDPDMDHWREAFSIEKVTKDFYREYARVFDTVEQAIGSQNGLAGEDLRLFTQTLFNRLMFLRFIERKKWLEFNGSTDYLAALYAAGGMGRRSFYRSRLHPLFFTALAIEGEQKSEAVGQVVFLNGGLFEEMELDKRVRDIPDQAFEGVLGPEGLFYRFNFTVQESTPFDIEVAVDPEMLGKVFEELVTGRHESGSYYTPRPIVSYMCRETLKGYLAENTSASRDAIAKLVDEQEIAGDLTDKHAEEILFYLETIKAIDPACGSGAYLLGLLQELISIRRTLQNPQLQSDADFLYNVKLNLISSCLYGVDIDPFATNVAKLRLWLSLAVEADTAQPLPNLDFKIETGDSVFGPCDPYTESPVALSISALRNRARQLILDKDRYMRAHGDKKKSLYEQIKSTEAAIAEDMSTLMGKGVVAWQVHFAEVFTSFRRQHAVERGILDATAFKVTSYEPGGFDVVVSNPPYVRIQVLKKTAPEQVEWFKKHYAAAAKGNYDLYVLFVERGLQLLSPRGQLAFILPHKFFNAQYGQPLRKLLAKGKHLRHVVHFGDQQVFPGATNYVCLLFLARAGADTCRWMRADNLAAWLPAQRAPETVLPAPRITEAEWNFVVGSGSGLFERLQGMPVKLGDVVDRISQGIRTSANEVYVLDVRSSKGGLISAYSEQLDREVAVERKAVLRFLQGREIKAYSMQPSGKVVLMPYRLVAKRMALVSAKDFRESWPEAWRYLSANKEHLESREDGRMRHKGWYGFIYPKNLDVMFSPKLLVPDIARLSRLPLEFGLRPGNRRQLYAAASFLSSSVAIALISCGS